MGSTPTVAYLEYQQVRFSVSIQLLPSTPHYFSTLYLPIQNPKERLKHSKLSDLDAAGKATRHIARGLKLYIASLKYR